MATVRARYEKGVLTPLEPLDLEEGKEVVVSVEDTPAPDSEDHANSSASSQDATPHSRGLLGILEMVEKMRESYPPNMWDGVPTDGAKNYEHYLYGHPKEEN